MGVHTMNLTPGIALNEDDGHYYGTRAGQALDAEKVASFVDQYAGTQVRELVLNPNAQRTSYGSKVWDPIWLGYDPDGPDDQPLFASTAPEDVSRPRGWVHTAWQLHEDGIDPYKLWIERARKQGISPWISMRMNDVHCVDDERSFIHSEFWRNNPQFRRVPYAFINWMDRAFDYGHKEVREHHLKLVREYAETWDFDGLELDWMRFGFHFRPGYEQEGCEILTEFTREVRSILDEAEKRVGHQIKLSARVPSRPQNAIGLGMDAVAWAKEGLIDSLVVTPFWATAETDMPIELWKMLLEGTKVELAAGLEILVRPFPTYGQNQTNTLETVRGMAASYIHRGCDKIYLFNYMDSETTMDDTQNYQTLLREIGSLETIDGKARRHVVTYTDTWAVGVPAAYSLPANIAAGNREAFRVHTGPATPGMKAKAVLGIIDGSSDLAVRCNGFECAALGEIVLSAPIPKFPTHAFAIPDEALRAGYNVLEVFAGADSNIGWVEIDLE